MLIGATSLEEGINFLVGTSIGDPLVYAYLFVGLSCDHYLDRFRTLSALCHRLIGFAVLFVFPHCLSFLSMSCHQMDREVQGNLIGLDWNGGGMRSRHGKYYP